VFYSANVELDNLVQLRGKRIAIGGEGSGTRKLGLDLLEASGAAAAPTRLLPLGGLAAVEALKAGKVDAIFLVGSANTGSVWVSLFTPGFRLMSLAHADAYTRRWPFLSKLVLPRGAIDLVRDIPAADVTLVASVVSLVPARTSTRRSSTRSRRRPSARPAGLFQRAGEFPNARAGGFPLSAEAERFTSPAGASCSATCRSGPRRSSTGCWCCSSRSSRSRSRLAHPAVADTGGGSARASKWYGQLKFSRRRGGVIRRAPREEWLKELDELESRANRIRTPLAYANQFYILREHIGLVRRNVQRAGDAPAVPAAAPAKQAAG
jgi:hypothetical protein